MVTSLPEPATNLSFDYPYILFVGKREGYKNFEILARVFSADKNINSNYRLIAFGGGTLITEEYMLTSYGIRSKVIHLSGDDSLLAYLYKHCSVFVFPSLYEGFGIPLLEALSQNASSL